MPASAFTLYDQSTGSIVATVRCEASFIDQQLRPGQGYVAGAFKHADHYVVAGDAVPRPENPATLDVPTIAADGVDVATVSGIPTGTLATIDGPTIAAIPVDDGSLELTADVPGTYTVRLESFPEKVKEFTVAAS